MRRLMPILALAAFLPTPVVAAEPLIVTLDKAELLRLSTDAADVIIGNPAYVDATIQDPRVLTLFGKRPGETNIIILNSSKKVVLNTAVVVRPESGRHVKVISPMKGAQGAAESNYSCAGRCSPTVLGEQAKDLAPVGEFASEAGR